MKTIKCPPYGRIMENSIYGQKGDLSGCSCHSYRYFELFWHMSWWTLPRGTVYVCLLHFLTSYSFLSPLQSGFFPCHFTSDLNFAKSNGRLSVPILLVSLPQSLLHYLFLASLSLCSSCLSSCSFLAPFWVPLLSMSVKWWHLVKIYLEPKLFSLCLCPKQLYSFRRL